MTDLDAELDALMRRTEEYMAEADRLAAAALEARDRSEQWLAANNVTGEKLDRFLEVLAPEDRAKVAEDEAAFLAEVRRDEEEAIAKSGLKKKAPRTPKKRNLA